jgi:nitrite reductase/ring-hydroxylating ferredoxin subunit
VAIEIARLPIGAMVEGELRRIEHPPFNVLVTHLEGRYHAISDNCPHAAQSLSLGRLEGTAVRCPRHGWLIDLRSGSVIGARAARGCHVYEVRVEGDELVIVDNLQRVF